MYECTYKESERERVVAEIKKKWYKEIHEEEKYSSHLLGNTA